MITKKISVMDAALTRINYVQGTTLIPLKFVVSDFEMPTTSNVLQWFTEDGLKVSVRPSGTEPKIKFYCEVPVPGQFDGDYVAATAKADARVEEIKKDLGLA